MHGISFCKTKTKLIKGKTGKSIYIPHWHEACKLYYYVWGMCLKDIGGEFRGAWGEYEKLEGVG